MRPRTAASCASARREPFDSINPFVAFNAQLVHGVHEHLPDARPVRHARTRSSGDWAKSWTTSKDGLTWTFKRQAGQVVGRQAADRRRRRLDGQPRSSSTPRRSPANARAVPLARDRSTAPEPDTLVIHYDKAVANVLPQLEQFFVLPQHVWEPIVGSERARASRTTTRRAHLPIVGGGSFFVTKYDKKGTTILAAQPGLLRAEAARSTPSASRGSRTPTR